MFVLIGQKAWFVWWWLRYLSHRRRLSTGARCSQNSCGKEEIKCIQIIHGWAIRVGQEHLHYSCTWSEWHSHAYIHVTYVGLNAAYFCAYNNDWNSADKFIPHQLTWQMVTCLVFCGSQERAPASLTHRVEGPQPRLRYHGGTGLTLWGIVRLKIRTIVRDSVFF